MAASQGKGKKQQSPGKKLKREVSRARAVKAAQVKREEQDGRAAANRADRKAGEATPWEIAKARRAAIRQGKTRAA